MTFLIALIFFVALPAAIAVALTHGLASFMPQASLRRRTVIAALMAGFLPMLVPIVAILFSGADPIALAALIVAATVLAAIVGFPIALYFGRKLEPPQPPERVFD